MWNIYQKLPESLRWLVLGAAMFAVNALSALLVKSAPDKALLLFAGVGGKGAALMLVILLLAPKWGRAFGLLLLGMLLASAGLYYASLLDGGVSAAAFQAQALGCAAAGLVLLGLWRFSGAGRA